MELSDALRDRPELAGLDFNGLNMFVRYATLVKPTIEFSQMDCRKCPTSLSPQICLFLASAPGYHTDLIELCQSAFRDLVWNQPPISPTEAEILEYNDTALQYETSFRHLYPPMRSCQDSGCSNHREDARILTLTEPLTYKATLFTVGHGALPIYTSSLYCRCT
ncbi:hypothetical protein C8J57DRAFT_1300171 [Mycena rebaudengoi]|nr:hypothetical protein C8J57DRAFT_1300171 [Mycena rebaudengoi]